MFRLLRLSRTLLLLALVTVLAAAGFVSAGRLLVDPGATDMPEPADAIVVLSGARINRWLEAYDLWRDGRAPIIVLSRGTLEKGARALAAQGIQAPSDADVAQHILVEQLGVPAAVVQIIDRDLDNTASEANATRDLATAHGWRRLIVVTSLPHTRRTAHVMRAVLAPAGVDVDVRATRYDDFHTSGWWRYRSDWRWMLTELPKLLAYRLGLGE